MDEHDDSLQTSLAHVILCCVAANTISRITGKSFINPGMHANFYTHGIIGVICSQEGISDNFLESYTVSLNATRYLSLPCLMADLYRGHDVMSLLHLLSGVIPFTLALIGEEFQWGNCAIAANIVSLVYHSVENSNLWGFYAAGAAILSYFVVPKIETPILYPLSLALMEFCAYRMFHVHYDL